MDPEEFERQGTWLRRKARRLMGSRLRGWTESADLAQQVQVEAWRTREGKTFANLAAFRGWLGRILSNLAASESKRRAVDRVLGGESQIASPVASPSRFAEVRDSGAHLKGRLSKLEERERGVVLSRVVDGLSFAQVATRHEVSEANARVIFHRALQKLRRGSEPGRPA